MLDQIDGFEWDEHNLSHISRHDVTAQEVEEVVCGRSVVVPARPARGEKRWKLFGRTNAGRFLVVVFTLRQKRLRPITSYTMNQLERRIYGPHFD